MLREAAVADREDRAVKTKEDAYSFCCKAEEDRQVALQRAQELQGELQATQDHHAEVSPSSSSCLNFQSHI